MSRHLSGISKVILSNHGTKANDIQKANNRIMSISSDYNINLFTQALEI